MISVPFQKVIEVVFFILVIGVVIALLVFFQPKILDMIGGIAYYITNLVNLILH